MFCFISKVVVVRWISVVDILDNLRGIGEMSHEPSPALNKHRIVTVLIFMDFFFKSDPTLFHGVPIHDLSLHNLNFFNWLKFYYWLKFKCLDLFITQHLYWNDIKMRRVSVSEIKCVLPTCYLTLG